MAADVTPTSDGPSAGVPHDVLLAVGDGRAISVELAGNELVIGRGDDCDVTLDHPELSRRHAVFQPGPPTTVRDLDSKNGTKIGKARHHGGPAVPLAAGDAFAIGPFTFFVVRRARREASMSDDLLRIDDPTPAGVTSRVRDVARSSANVLVLGETGVGKEVLATTIHELSGRAGVLTRVNCAALNDNLLESELFGHEKGSFTGATAQRIGLLEAAAGGTVFLDEIGELSQVIQAKLLRAVENREVLRIGSTRPIALDLRFVAATHRDLLADVDAGRFRRDLYFRLDGVQLVIPPLRERRAAIGTLAARFLDDAAARTGKQLRLSRDAMAALEQHAWPGNVRELKAVIERAALFAADGEIIVRHLRFSRPAAILSPQPAPGGDDLDAAQRADRDAILQALEDCAGNQTRAAKQLGISRSTLLIKLRVYRISRPRG
jgi:two-component system response regulator AtoC